MKILISAGFFGEIPYADNIIEIALAKEFKRQGHSCDVIGMTYDIEKKKIEYDSVDVYKIPYAKQIVMDARLMTKQFFKTDGSTRLSKYEKIIFLCQHPIYSLVMQMNKFKYFREYLISNYADEVEKIILKNKYDLLISVVFSFEKTEELLLNPKIKITKMYYQLDPFAFNESTLVSDLNHSILREVEVMKAADMIVTTEELFEQYKKNKYYFPLVEKMMALKFPTFNDFESQVMTQSAIHFSSDKLNLLFCGTIDDGPRNPIKALSILEKIVQENCKIHIYFLGRFESKIGKKFIQEHPENFTIVNPVSQQVAMKTMQCADVLLNISNTYRNMVPSKIFTYFELGKPILNFQKIPYCPARKYFDKYELAYTIEEYADNYDIMKVIHFLKYTKGKTIPFNICKQIFIENTPSFVAKQLLQMYDRQRKSNS